MNEKSKERNPVMFLRRWNYFSKKYDQIEIPNDWKVSLDCEEGKEYSCAGCGKEINRNTCFTSAEIHDSLGFGYAICEDCAKLEHMRIMQHGID